MELPDVTIQWLLVNLALSVVLTSVLAWHYVKFGRTLANRRAFARNFLMIGFATVLVISVVKSSLALSLGLVGALSIVRFRTPIKEPEELAYLFFTIAIGLGLGADQRWPTVLATVFVLLVLTARGYWKSEGRPANLFLDVEVPTDPDGGPDFATIASHVGPHVRSLDLRRLDVRDGVRLATFYVDCQDDAAVLRVVETLREKLPAGASVSFVDQNTNLGV